MSDFSKKLLVGGLTAAVMTTAFAAPGFAQASSAPPAAASSPTPYDPTLTGSIDGSYYQGSTQRGSFEANAPTYGVGDVGSGGPPAAGGEGFGSGGE